MLLGLASLVVVSGFVTPWLAALGLGLDLLVLLLVLADARAAAATPLVTTRELPPTLHQGEPAEAALCVDNPTGHPVVARFREALHARLSPGIVELEARLAPGTRTRLAYALRPRLRGRAPLAPLAVRVQGPLALAWAGRTLDLQQVVRVYPKAHLEGRAGLVVRHAASWRSGANPLERRGISTELYALRPYQPGDALRQIHWKASARRDAPVTRETCWEQHQHIVVLVDCGRPMAALAGEMSKLDHALAAVLGLLRVVVAQNDSADVVLFSQEILRVVRVDRRAGGFARVFEQVHDVAADLDEPDWEEVVAWCLRRATRRSLVLCCTSVLDALGAERLAEALARLATRHRPLLVNLEDPGLMRHARAVPDDLEGACAKTSAMGVLARIEGMGRQLRAAGVNVVSMPASELAIGIIDRYLAFKARRGA